MVISILLLSYQLLFIHIDRRMIRTLYGLDAAINNSFIGLTQGVNNCLSLYNNMAVLSFGFSLEVDYFGLIIS